MDFLGEGWFDNKKDDHGDHPLAFHCIASRYAFPSIIILLNIDTEMIVVLVNFCASLKSASPVIK